MCVADSGNGDVAGADVRYCSRCAQNYEPGDEKNHRVCVATKPVATRKVVATQRKPKADIADVGARIHRPPTGERQANAASKPTESERVEKWRKANREKYNKRMREYRAARRSLGIPYG